jgi:sortase A
MMLFAGLLAAGVAVAIWLRSGQPEVANADPQADQWIEQARKHGGSNRGEQLKIEKETTTNTDLAPLLARDWPQPSGQEVQATQAPRYYQPQQDAQLSLTVEAIGLNEVPVINSKSPEALDRGVIHLPETPMPWDEKKQKNVFLAGHRLGWEGTGSRLVFYNLNKLKKGDSVVLKDGSGTPYNYRVSDVFVATPDADWVVQPLRGHDMLTLQTCTMPDFKNRLIVRADRV